MPISNDELYRVRTFTLKVLSWNTIFKMKFLKFLMFWREHCGRNVLFWWEQDILAGTFCYFGGNILAGTLFVRGYTRHQILPVPTLCETVWKLLWSSMKRRLKFHETYALILKPWSSTSLIPIPDTRYPKPVKYRKGAGYLPDTYPIFFKLVLPNTYLPDLIFTRV